MASGIDWDLEKEWEVGRIPSATQLRGGRFKKEKLQLFNLKTGF